MAVSRGSVEITELVIEAGADLNAQDKVGNTALHGAALQDRVQAAQVLIQAEADVNISNDKRQTPADLAHGQRHSRLVAVLTAAGGERSGQEISGEEKSDQAD